MPPIITLTTDFGLRDSFVAAMKGVLLTRCPDASLVDVTHEVPPGDVRSGALRLAAAAPYFPPATVHLAVVDPGVGSARRAIAVESGGQFFVGPDNGLLSLAAPFDGQDLAVPSSIGSRDRSADRSASSARAVELTNRGFWLSRVSQTFHGRDIFAPAAAYLAATRRLDDLGDPISDLVQLDLPRPVREGRRLHGVVLDIDRFGNLASNICRDDVGQATIQEVEVGGRHVQGLSAWYDPDQAFVAVFNGEGRLEVAAPGRSAAAELGVAVDAPVTVVLRP